MSKKNFAKGIDAFFSVEKTKKPDASTLEKKTSFIIEKDVLDKIKALAYWERKTVKNILKECIDQFFTLKDRTYIQEAIENYHNHLQK